MHKRNIKVKFNDLKEMQIMQQAAEDNDMSFGQYTHVALLRLTQSLIDQAVEANKPEAAPAEAEEAAPEQTKEPEE